MVYGEYENPPTLHIFMDSIPSYTSFSLFSLSGLPIATSDIYFQTSMYAPGAERMQDVTLVDIFITKLEMWAGRKYTTGKQQLRFVNDLPSKLGFLLG